MEPIEYIRRSYVAQLTTAKGTLAGLSSATSNTSGGTNHISSSVPMRCADIASLLSQQLKELIHCEQLDHGSTSLSLPFSLPNGDNFEPVIHISQENAKVIIDDGGTCREWALLNGLDLDNNSDHRDKYEDALKTYLKFGCMHQVSTDLIVKPSTADSLLDDLLSLYHSVFTFCIHVDAGIAIET